MEIITKHINEIKPYEKNPRNNDNAVQYVANSIKEFGWKVPIVIDKDGVIVAGHTRYKAAQQLGIEQVPCVIADDLTPEQIKAYRIADNKTAEAASWNFIGLATELGDIQDIDLTDFNFSESEIDGLVGLSQDMGYIFNDIPNTETQKPIEGTYTPNYSPTIDTKEITCEDVREAATEEKQKYEQASKMDYIKKNIIICPYCGKEIVTD